MRQVILFFVWLVAAIMMFDCAFNLINKPLTIANLFGFTILVLTILGSYETRCFTKFKLTNKEDEKTDN